MALKTFNIDEKIYKQFSKYCKKEGISMSKKVERFIGKELEKIKNPAEKKFMEEPKKDEIMLEEHPLRKYC